MRNWSRREFARHAGIATLFAPFLSLLEEKPAQAAAGKAKYLLVFFSNGTDVGAWSPKGSTESSVAFSPMTELLSPLKSNLVLVEKLNSNGSANSHGSPGGLTGMGQGNPTHISVEQFVSDALRAAGVRTQIPNLLLGGVAAGSQSTFYRAGRALSPIYSPTAAHQVIFSGGLADTSPTAAEDRLRRRQSVLDLCRGELTALSQTLGAQERQKLELHTDSIRQLEERLTQQNSGQPGGGVSTVECKPSAAPGNGSEPLAASALHLDIAVQAFACDLTRVAAVQFGHHQSTQVSLADVGSPGDWHNDFLHSDSPRQRLLQVERWLCKQFVAVADKLKATPAPDGAGTLWDQTLIFWARDMGDAVSHDGSDMRFVFSGGAGGYLRTSPNGRYLAGAGDYHLRALMNVCEAMGVTDLAGFGDSKAPPDQRTPLPGIAMI